MKYADFEMIQRTGKITGVIGLTKTRLQNPQEGAMSLFEDWLLMVCVYQRLDKRTRAAKKIDEGLRLFWADATDIEIADAARKIANLFDTDPREIRESLKKKRASARRILYPNEWN